MNPQTQTGGLSLVDRLEILKNTTYKDFFEGHEYLEKRQDSVLTNLKTPNSKLEYN